MPQYSTGMKFIPLRDENFILHLRALFLWWYEFHS